MNKAPITILSLSLLCLCLSATARGDDGSAVEKDSLSALSLRSRRSDDASVVEAVLGQHSQALAEMKAELSALKTRTAELETVVCFSAHFARADVSGLGLNQPVVFDVVPYNAGAGYDKHTGIFRVPAAGTYVLSLNIQRHGSDQDTIIMAIRKGDTTLGAAEAGYSPYEHGTTVVTTHLKEGDAVTVQPVHGTVVYGGLSTVFSAFRISPK